jgi:hypothetical protein
MASLTELLLGVAVSLAAAEIVAYAPYITRWLINRAVLKLPEKDKERFSEEWLAHAECLPGSISKLRHGAGCYFKAARRISRFRKAPDGALSRRVLGALVNVYIWARFANLHIPALFNMARSGRWNNIRAYIASFRIIAKTFILEVIYLGHGGAQVQSALRARLKEIEEIISPKEAK